MDNSNKIILDLCGGTGAWSRPYKEAGYDVRLITLPEKLRRPGEYNDPVSNIIKAVNAIIDYLAAKEENENEPKK